MGKEAMFVLNCGHSAQSVLDIIQIWLDHEWCIYNSEGMAWYCDVGFTVLSRDTSEIIIGLDYNRKTISEGYTDVSWYYDAIIKLLIMNGCKPEHIEYSEL